MASNFIIAIDKNRDGVGLKLAGDFDATSAYELIHAIKKLPDDTAKISIHTNGLKNVHPFGSNVFCRLMNSLNGQSTKIVFKGNNASQLSLGSACQSI
jgi:ABC-type transporter Mla MlaB component